MLPDLELALRMIEAAACCIHAILDITDPCHNAKSAILKVEDTFSDNLLIPGGKQLFFPAMGLLRAFAA
jgi:hypothetical protein